MDSVIFSGSIGSDYQIERADFPEHEPEPQKKPTQKPLKSDKKRSQGRPHQIRYIKPGPKNSRSSTR
jgi:hypothetical protein